jgi:hypothetical protein
MKRLYYIILVIALFTGCSRNVSITELPKISENSSAPLASPSPKPQPPSEIGNNAFYIHSSPVVAGIVYFAGLRKDGTVIAKYIVSSEDPGECDVSDWKDIVAIDVGAGHIVGLTKDGTVLATGSNPNGQCDVSDWKDIVAITANYGATFGLKKDGTIVTTDSEVDLSSWKDMVAIDGGGFHVAGLKKDGTVLTFGSYFLDECKELDWEDVMMISAGRDYTAGLMKDGTVVCSGVSYKISNNHKVVSISTGSTYVAMLTEKGTVETYGGAANGGYASWKDIIAISAGELGLVGVKKDGSVVVVGEKAYESTMADIQEWDNIGIPQ